MPDLVELDRIELLHQLAEEAQGEGHAFVARMVVEWSEGTNRFDRAGESAYVATVADRIVGVGGLNIDRYVFDPRVGRVRHLYVSAGHRRMGVASMLVDRIVGDARMSFDLLRLRTPNPDAAAFYCARGFAEVVGDEFCTHSLDLA